MLAAVLHGVGDLRLEQVAIPEPAPGEVLVRVRACGICASDLPRIFDTGPYRFPLIPGHELSGEVERLGPQALGVEPGTRVTVYPLIPCGRCQPCRAGLPNLCDDYDYLGSRRDGAFAQYVAAPAVNCLPLPQNVSCSAGALTEPCAVAVHAVRRAQVRLGDVAAVLGAGPVGIAIGVLCQLSGARVIMADVDDRKLEAAATFGLGETVNVGAGVEALLSAAGATRVVFEAAGAPPAFRAAAAAVAKRGAIVLVGNMAGDVQLSQDEYSGLLRREVKVSGSWNSIPWGQGNDWATALDLMRRGLLPAQGLISHRFPLERVEEALALLRGGGSHYRVILEM